MILAYNFGVEERLTEWADANQDQPLGRDIRAAVYEVRRLQGELQQPADPAPRARVTRPRDARELMLSQALRLQKAFKAQYEANARDAQSLKNALATLDERTAALAIAIRLMGLHLELVTPGGVGRDGEAWEMAQHRVKVLKDLWAELEAIRDAGLPQDETPYDNLQGTQ